MRSVMDAKAAGWGVGSDHRAIVMRKRIIRTIWRPRAPLVRVDRNKLRDENVAKEFRDKVQANRAHLISEYGRALTADEERCALEEAMRATAMDVLKADKGRLRSGWFGAHEAKLRSVIDKRDDRQKRYSAMWVPTAEIKAELKEARKAVRRVVREAKKSWALTLVSEINNRESADDRRPISPKEVWQVIRALQKGPRVVRAVKPLNLRKNQLTGMGEMCETEEENWICGGATEPYYLFSSKLMALRPFSSSFVLSGGAQSTWATRASALKQSRGQDHLARRIESQSA
jgi:hypothetical protein